MNGPLDPFTPEDTDIEFDVDLGANKVTVRPGMEIYLWVDRLTIGDMVFRPDRRMRLKFHIYHNK